MTVCDDLTRIDTLLAFAVASVLHFTMYARGGDAMFFATTFVIVFLVLKNLIL